jgi:hypothetical protein
VLLRNEQEPLKKIRKPQKKQQQTPTPGAISSLPSFLLSDAFTCFNLSTCDLLDWENSVLFLFGVIPKSTFIQPKLGKAVCIEIIIAV